MPLAMRNNPLWLQQVCVLYNQTCFCYQQCTVYPVGETQHVSRDVVFPVPHKDERTRNAKVLFVS